MYIKSHLIKCIIWKLLPPQPLPYLKIYGDNTVYANLKLLKKSTVLKLQINGCKHGSINPALVFRPGEGLHFMCLCFHLPHCMIGRYAEIFFLSFFFPLLFRGLLGSLCVCVCVSVQAITLQFEFILTVKRNSNLYAPLLSAPLGHCQLSSQQFKERAVMSTSMQGVKGRCTQITAMFLFP